MQNKMKLIESELNAAYPDRQEFIHGLILAAISGNHIFVLGPPGTAKSEITEEFLSRCKDAAYFEYLLTATTTADELYGPPSIPILKDEGKYRRVTEGMLPECEVAFLDEIWKGGSSTLNSLLGIMGGSRRFTQGGKVSTCPLLFTVGASNELPQDDSLEALYARFALRYEVAAVRDPEDMGRILWGDEVETKGQFTMAALKKSQKAAAKIPMSEKAKKGALEIADELALAGIKVDMRRLFWALSDRTGRPSIVQAEAWLWGRDEVKIADLHVLQHVVWRDPSERRGVSKIIRTISQPLAERLQSSLDEVVEECALLNAAAAPTFDQVAGVLDRARKLGIEITKAARTVTGAEQEQLESLVRSLRPIKARLAQRVSGEVSA